MTLIESNNHTLTICMTNDEYSKLLIILGATSAEYSKIDPEILTMSEAQLEEIVNSFYALSGPIS